jgi:site-specific recombinase XerD
MTTTLPTSSSSSKSEPPPVNLVYQFRTFLEGTKKLSASSIKNYVSDINLFCEWLKNNLQEDALAPAHITESTISAYREYLNNSRQSISAKNRHLSSLRRFGYFLKITGLCDFNPAEGLINVDQSPTSVSTKKILKAFKAELNKQQLSASTIKNYLSDVKQYLHWAANPPTDPQNDSKITDDILNSRK